MWIDGDTIIRIASILGAILTIGGVLTAIIKFVIKIKMTEKEINNSLTALQEKHNLDIKATNDELTIITYGVLSCLRGLKEQGCDGPVNEAIGNIEAYINQKAHT